MANSFVKEKNIIVKSVGTLDILGGVTGPILKPFKKDVKTIMHLINTGKEVYEVLEDGSQVKLSIRNYDKLMTVTPKAAKAAPPTGAENNGAENASANKVIYKENCENSEKKEYENKQKNSNNKNK